MQKQDFLKENETNEDQRWLVMTDGGKIKAITHLNLKIFSKTNRKQGKKEKMFRSFSVAAL